MAVTGVKVFAGAMMAATLTLAPPARADEDDVAWTWRRVGPLDYTAGLAFGAAILADRLVEPPTVVRWGYGWELDRSARDALVLGSGDVRLSAARASDVTLGLVSAQPYVDAVIAWTVHGSLDTAWQISVVSATAMLFNLATTGLVKRLSGRDRPITIACNEDPDYDPTCGARPPRAFYSGHTSSAFTAASLTCLHHGHLALYGEGWDELACVSAMSAAAMVGYERLVSDRHHMTDVLTGAAAGTVSGALLPWLLYSVVPTPETDWLVWPRLSADQLGVTAVTGF